MAWANALALPSKNRRSNFKSCPWLHATMPSLHVCSKFVSPSSPHFWNQEPPRAQQLPLPDFLFTPHFGHEGVGTTVVVSTRDIAAGATDTKVGRCATSNQGHHLQRHSIERFSVDAVGRQGERARALPLHEAMPSVHVCSNFALGSPHFPNQEPPRAQQLGSPDCACTPQFGHTDMEEILIDGTRDILACTVGICKVPWD